MYMCICPSMIYILNSHHIGRVDLILFVNPIFLLVCGAYVGPPMDWKRHEMFYGLIELPQGQIFFFQKYNFSLSWERLKGHVNKCHGKSFSLSPMRHASQSWGPSIHVGDDQPFSLLIVPNGIHWMFEWVITCCASHHHFECSPQPLWVRIYPLHPYYISLDFGLCHSNPSHSISTDSPNHKWFWAMYARHTRSSKSLVNKAGSSWAWQIVLYGVACVSVGN